MSSGLSQIDIVNRALIKIGDSTITSLDENNERARTMKALYNGSRDSLLRECPWNFASKRASLSASTDTPVYRWANKFPLPADFLYMVATENNSAYRMEENNLLSDASGSLNITYVRRVEVTTEFDAGFTEALVLKLAYEASARLSQDPATEQRLRQDAEVAMIRAKKFDGMEDDPVQYSVDDWDLARGSGFAGFAEEDC